MDALYGRHGCKNQGIFIQFYNNLGRSEIYDFSWRSQMGITGSEICKEYGDGALVTPQHNADKNLTQKANP